MNKLFSFDFQTSVSKVTETSKGKAIVKGTLLIEGVSRNGNVYTIEEMKTIAQRTVGVPNFLRNNHKDKPQYWHSMQKPS